ncbi:MAG: cytochrome c [Flavobacteriales bacterium]
MAVTRAVTLLAIVAMAMACGEAPDATKAVADDGRPDGEGIYGMYCELCHGADGKLGVNGAKDLTQSLLSRDEMLAVVSHGRKTMAAYATVLNAAQIEAVVDHVRALHKVP